MKLNRQKLFRVFGTVLGVSLITAAVFLKNPNQVTAQGELGFEELVIRNNYSAFTYFEVPTCTFVAGEEKQVANHTLIFPDGNATKESALNLEQAGEYKVIYSTVYDNITYEKVYTFNVEDALYGVENGKNNYPTYADDQFGGALNAVLADGESLKFYQPIDLNKVNKQSLIQFYNIASMPGNYDAEIIVTLTDAYNPNMNVKVRYFCIPEEGGTTMVQFSVNGSRWICLSGASATTNGVVEYNGQYYLPNLSYAWGHNLHGANLVGGGRTIWLPSLTDDNPTTPWWGEDRGLSVMPMNLYYDSETHSLYFRSGYDYETGLIFFADVDYQPFTGKYLKWTTGEVYLSVEGAGFRNATVNLMVEDVFGMDLSKNALPDNAEPEINIDLQGYDENDLPKAVVGQPYNLFNATAVDKLNPDVYSPAKVEVKTGVYYNYYSDKKIYKQLVNGTFTPTVAGKYFIEYTSSDNFGHTAKKVLLVEAVNKTDKATLTLSNKKTECEIAQYITLFDSLVVENVFGREFYEISVKDKNGVEYVIDDSFTFAPKSLGEYKISIVYGGYAEKYKEEYTLTLTGEGKNIYLEKPVFERYYINNATYKIPEIEVNKLTANGNTKQEVVCKVIADGNNSLELKNNSFLINAKNSIVIEYYVGTEKIYESPSLPVVDVGFKSKQLKVDKYFDADGYALVVNTEGTTVTIEDINAKEFTFIRPLQTARFNASFSFFENLDDFDAFYMVLTDSKNTEDKLEIKFYKESGAYYYVMGDAMDKFDKANIFFNYEDGAIQFAGKNAVAVEKYADGRTFEGFKSGYAYLSFRFENAKENQAAILLTEINGQLLTARKKDDVAPQSIFKTFTGSYTVGDIITLHPMIFADVYDPCIEREAYVKDSKGEYVVALDGTILDNTADYSKSYQIQLKELGKYSVYCKSTDSSGNTKRASIFSVTVKDLIPPKVSIKNAVTIANANSTVDLGTLCIEDNTSTFDNCLVSIYYCDMNKVMRKVDGTSIKVGEAGVYTIYYLVQDEAKNFTEFKYSIEVK